MVVYWSDLNFPSIYDPPGTPSPSHVDISTDENGLWFLFGLAALNHTVVATVDRETMEPKFMWELTLNPHMMVSDGHFPCYTRWYVRNKQYIKHILLIRTKDKNIRLCMRTSE